MAPSVLIIEDSLTQAQLIGRLFERAGFAPGLATNRPNALQELARQTWALLVIDVFMADENSLDHIDDYRRAAPNTPIAVMTAIRKGAPLAASHSLNAARRARVDFILPKPFRFEDIQQVCQEVIHRRDNPNPGQILYL
jgi:DNA-binding NtrC family response regulator